MEKIQDLKKDTFFKRTETAKKIYSKGAYNQAARGWECTSEEDINDTIIVKKGKEVFVNFEY